MRPVVQPVIQILIFCVLFSFGVSYGEPIIEFHGIWNCETAGGIESNGEQPVAVKKTVDSFDVFLCDENSDFMNVYEGRRTALCEGGRGACRGGENFLGFGSPVKKSAEGFLPGIKSRWNLSGHRKCDFSCSAMPFRGNILHRDCYMRTLERAVIGEEMIDRKTGISYLSAEWASLPFDRAAASLPSDLSAEWASLPFDIKMEFKGGNDTTSFQKFDLYSGEPLGGGGGGGGSQEIREGWFHGRLFLEKETALTGDELLKALEQGRLAGAAVWAYFLGGAAVSFDKAGKFGLPYSHDEGVAVWGYSVLPEDGRNFPEEKGAAYLFVDSFEEMRDSLCASSRFSK